MLKSITSDMPFFLLIRKARRQWLHEIGLLEMKTNTDNNGEHKMKTKPTFCYVRHLT